MRGIGAVAWAFSDARASRTALRRALLAEARRKLSFLCAHEPRCIRRPAAETRKQHSASKGDGAAPTLLPNRDDRELHPLARRAPSTTMRPPHTANFLGPNSGPAALHHPTGASWMNLSESGSAVATEWSSTAVAAPRYSPVELGMSALRLAGENPLWLLGVAMMSLGSLSSSCGMLLLKRASSGPDPPPWYRNGYFWGGALMLVANASLLDVIAFAITPLSLIAPFAGMTIVFTVLLAGCGCVGVHEPPPRAALAAVGLVVVGVTLSAVFGPHSDKALRPPELEQLFDAHPWLPAFSLSGLPALALLKLAAHATRARAASELAARCSLLAAGLLRPLPPVPPGRPLLPRSPRVRHALGGRLARARAARGAVRGRRAAALQDGGHRLLRLGADGRQPVRGTRSNPSGACRLAAPRAGCRCRYPSRAAFVLQAPHSTSHAHTAHGPLRVRPGML